MNRILEFLKGISGRVSAKWIGWVGAASALYLFGYLTGRPVDIPEPPPFVGEMGRVENAEETAKAIADIEVIQGFPADFSRIAQGAIGADDDEPFFFWLAEEKVLGKIIPSWDQGSVGSCVSFGYGRAAQDLLLWQIASGKQEEWPGYEVATEPIYGGSRVEIGGGRISGDGSIGAWANKWLMTRGVNVRKKYDTYDLTRYSESLCRDFGRRGVPDVVEEAAKLNPVQAGALVRTADEVWVAIGNGYPVPICSNVGFQSPLVKGFCAPSGTWNHCMTVRGRFVHPTRGKCFVIQNSWGDYIRAKTVQDGEIDVVGLGKIKLPQGCFAVESKTIDRIVKQNDSFALSNLKGFPSRKPQDWLIRLKDRDGTRYADSLIRPLKLFRRDEPCVPFSLSL